MLGLRRKKKIAHLKTQKYLSAKTRKKILSSLREHREVNLQKKVLSLVRKIRYWQQSRCFEADLHQLRIDIKSIRYFLEAVHLPYDYLEDLLDILGRVHDLEMLEVLHEKNQLVHDDRLQLQRTVKNKLSDRLTRALVELESLSGDPVCGFKK